MGRILNELRTYLSTSSQERLDEDWEELKQYNEYGPIINTNIMGRLIREFENGLTVVPTKLIRDKGINYQSKFLYCYLASKNQLTNLSFTAIRKEIEYTDSEISSAVKELCDFGWLKEIGDSNGNGLFEDVSYKMLFTSFKEQECNTEQLLAEKKIKSKKKVDYQSYVDVWNIVLGSKTSKVQIISQKRQQSIRNRVENGITIEKFMKICLLLETRSFMFKTNKEREIRWQPNFDWLIGNTKDCCNRLLEGQYHSYSEQDKRIYEDIMANGTVDIDKLKEEKYTDDTRPDGYDDTDLGRWSKSRMKWIK